MGDENFIIVHVKGVDMVAVQTAITAAIQDKGIEPKEGDDVCTLSVSFDRYCYSQDAVVDAEDEDFNEFDEETPEPVAKTLVKEDKPITIDRAGNHVIERDL